MKKISKYLLICGVIIVPVSVFAAGLVPCGGPGNPCHLCDFVKLIDNVIKFMLFYLALPACVIALIIAGIVLLSSVGSAQKIEKGKKIFFYALWGLILAFAAFLIVHIILVILVEPGYLNFTNGIGFPNCSGAAASGGGGGGGGGGSGGGGSGGGGSPFGGGSSGGGGVGGSF